MRDMNTMIRTIKTTSLMTATGIAALAFMQPAMALDAQTFVDRIEAVYRVMGYDMSFGEATLSGDTITVDIWKDGKEISFEARVKSRNATVIKNGLAVLR